MILTEQTENTLSNSNIIDNVIDLTNDEKKVMDEKSSRNVIPPLQGLLKADKSFNTESWQQIELNNLTQMENLTEKRLFMCDLELKNLYASLSNGGLLPISKTLHSEIPDLHPKNATYLVIRRRETEQFRAVIGMAKVCFKIKNRIEVHVEYVCLSRAHYVLNPWCDDQLFANGQEVTCVDDVELLLAMYKMSARHKKFTPVFAHVFVCIALFCFIIKHL